MAHRQVHRLPVAEVIREKLVSAFEFQGEHSGDGNGVDKAKKGSFKGYPVQVEVEEKIVEETEKKLSPECKTRFNAMMNGKGPKMSAFKEHNSPEGEKSCGKLEGSICATKAELSESMVHTDGRKLSQAVVVEGNSCVPRECTRQDDLSNFAEFMRMQTKEVIPGEDILISLKVDCSASGGGSVFVDGQPRPPPRSGAAALRLAAAVVAAVAGGTALAA